MNLKSVWFYIFNSILKYVPTDWGKIDWKKKNYRDKKLIYSFFFRNIDLILVKVRTPQYFNILVDIILKKWNTLNKKWNVNEKKEKVIIHTHQVGAG